MNGYKMLADSYRALLNDATTNQDNIRTHITALDFLAKCDKATIYALFDSSAFNDIVKGYVSMVADNAEELTDEQKSHLKYHVESLFDMVSARQAEDYYYSH